MLCFAYLSAAFYLLSLKICLLAIKKIRYLSNFKHEGVYGGRKQKAGNAC